jgi:hypothetical protein
MTFRNSRPSSVSRDPGNVSHRTRPITSAGARRKCFGRFLVEQDEAPVAVERIEAFTDAVEDGRETGFGAERGDLFGNEGSQLGGEQGADPEGVGQHYRHSAAGANAEPHPGSS